MGHTWASGVLKSLGLDLPNHRSPEWPAQAGCPGACTQGPIHRGPRHDHEAEAGSQPGDLSLHGCWGAGDPAPSLPASFPPLYSTVRLCCLGFMDLIVLASPGGGPSLVTPSCGFSGPLWHPEALLSSWWGGWGRGRPPHGPRGSPGPKNLCKRS